jgi:uncharacterized protein YjbI with pentapeptide repeats
MPFIWFLRINRYSMPIIWIHVKVKLQTCNFTLISFSGSNFTDDFVFANWFNCVSQNSLLQCVFVHIFFLCLVPRWFKNVRRRYTASNSSCVVYSIDGYTFSLTWFVTRHTIILGFADGFLPISDPKSVSQVCYLTTNYMCWCCWHIRIDEIYVLTRKVKLQTCNFTLISFSGSNFTDDFVFANWSLFDPLNFLFWSLCCLFFFNSWIPITPLVSSNSSYFAP